MSRYPYGLSPDITPTSTPTKLTKAQKSRARREPSGVFSLFSPPQIQQFREAFSLIDHDGDGLVGEQDLKHIFTSLGKFVNPHRSPIPAITPPARTTLLMRIYDLTSRPRRTRPVQASPPRAQHSTSCSLTAQATGVEASAAACTRAGRLTTAATAESRSRCSSR